VDINIPSTKGLSDFEKGSLTPMTDHERSVAFNSDTEIDFRQEIYSEVSLVFLHKDRRGR